MYKENRFIALIPARGGSKGIPHKNIIDVAGKPLIAYSIETAKQSSYIDEVIVTTDCEKIAEVSKLYGANVPFLRPANLATDEAKTVDAVLHTLDNIKEDYDYIVLLQPTQPLRTAKQIDDAIEHIIQNNATSLVSVSKVKQHPILMRTMDTKGKLYSLLGENSTVRRQDFKDIYIVDGLIYINKIDNLSNETSLNDNELAYVTKTDVIDIDSIEDLKNFKSTIKC